MKKLLHSLLCAGLAAGLTAGMAGSALARPDIVPLARTCNGCHGIVGVSVATPIPSLAGLPKDYLKNLMKQWKYGERTAITMDRIVKGLSDDQIDALAEYFAKLPWTPVIQPVPEAVLLKGKAVAERVCRDCHGLTGNDPDVGVPKINGQWAKYMELELVKYRSADFRMPHRKMKRAAQDLKPDEVSAVARYYAAQGK